MSLRVTRHSNASWQGTAAEGGGRLELGSGAFEGPLTLRARVEDMERATNPEELIAAAEAGCFTMSLANLLSDAGHPPQNLQTTANIRLEQQDGRFTITQIALETVGQVDGVSYEQFAQLAAQAKRTCPVSRALSGVEITIDAKLAGT